MRKFLPDINAVSIYEIDYKSLKKKGIKLLVFDLDNTLTDIRGKEIDKQLDLITNLKELDFEIIIVSNNVIKKRVAHWGEALDIPYTFAAFKPRMGVYRRILKKYNIKAFEMAGIGDQLITDILGANLIGATSILINPIKSSDEVLTKVSRSIENMIIKYYQKKGIRIRKY